MVRYSFPARLFYSQLHAGLSRRIGRHPVYSRDNPESGCLSTGNGVAFQVSGFIDEDIWQE